MKYSFLDFLKEKHQVFKLNIPNWVWMAIFILIGFYIGLFGMGMILAVILITYWNTRKQKK